MATPPKKGRSSNKQEPSEADLAYAAELARKKKVNIILASAVSGFTLLLGMLLAGNYFSGILGFFGLRSLYNERTGIYADCSKKENRDSPYCKPKVSQSDRDWSEMRDSKGRMVPFTLHD